MIVKDFDFGRKDYIYNFEEFHFLLDYNYMKMLYFGCKLYCYLKNQYL